MAISPTRQMLPLAPPRRTIASRDSEVLMRRREVAVDAKKKTKVWGALRQAARASPSSKWIPRTEEMDFQVIGDHEKFTAEDVVRFIHDWFIRYPDSEVHIGADSKKRGGNTAYVVGICLYHKGQGGTVLYHRKVVPSVGSNLERLWIELEIAMEVSNYVRREIGGELGEEQKISVHIDYNPEPMYKVSNALYSSGCDNLIAADRHHAQSSCSKMCVCVCVCVCTWSNTFFYFLCVGACRDVNIRAATHLLK